MGEVQDNINMFHRLRVEAAQTRLCAIESQLSFGFTLCVMAERELAYGHADEARLLIEKVQYVSKTVDRHLDEPNHVPPDQVAGCRYQLAQLESRILKIEAQLK
jgi:hypothetical protein